MAVLIDGAQMGYGCKEYDASRMCRYDRRAIDRNCDGCDRKTDGDYLESMGLWVKGVSHLACSRCSGVMMPGIAIQQTRRGYADFPGDLHATTVSAGGPGRLISVSKCQSCGWSVTS